MLETSVPGLTGAATAEVPSGLHGNRFILEIWGVTSVSQAPWIFYLVSGSHLTDRNHSWKGSGGHMRCWGLNLVIHVQSKYPTVTLASVSFFLPLLHWEVILYQGRGSFPLIASETIQE